MVRILIFSHIFSVFRIFFWQRFCRLFTHKSLSCIDLLRFLASRSILIFYDTPHQVTDVRSGSVNDLLTPGRNARITGGKLKVAGDSADNGVYFVNEATAERVKVDAADIVENRNAHLLVVVPALAAGTYRLEVSTQYTSSTDLLKTPRTAVFDRSLTVA